MSLNSGIWILECGFWITDASHFSLFTVVRSLSHSDSCLLINGTFDNFLTTTV
jgi:hypothetical protein